MILNFTEWGSNCSGMVGGGDGGARGAGGCGADCLACMWVRQLERWMVETVGVRVDVIHTSQHDYQED